jgi:hypothetical protein
MEEEAAAVGPDVGPEGAWADEYEEEEEEEEEEGEQGGRVEAQGVVVGSELSG